MLCCGSHRISEPKKKKKKQSGSGIITRDGANVLTHELNALNEVFPFTLKAM